MAQDHVSYVDHIPVISIGQERAPLALWIPPLGMTKEDMRPVLESLAGAGFSRRQSRSLATRRARQRVR
jgi:hypothetical protein